jgi:NTP pyrophosphatase (non-canonical NTP hydrolase)
MREVRHENQGSITAWQIETFGPTTPWLAFQRMQKEYWELRDMIHAGYFEKARVECADVLITLFRVAEALGFDLLNEVNHKMAINRVREWDVDADGHGQHR